MKISYDTQVDALYIRFLNGPFPVTTQRLSEDVAVNYSPDGRIVGIEVLDASNYAFTNEAKGQIELDNLVAVSSTPAPVRCCAA